MLRVILNLTVELPISSKMLLCIDYICKHSAALTVIDNRMFSSCSLDESQLSHMSTLISSNHVYHNLCNYSLEYWFFGNHFACFKFPNISHSLAETVYRID